MVIYRSYGRLQPPTAAEAFARDSAREPSRVIGYHNAIDDDLTLSDAEPAPTPPSYGFAILAPLRPFLPSTSEMDSGPESLPPYECTVSLEGSASVKFERTNPFETLEDTQWADVFMILRGTVLSIHQLQTVGKFSKAFGSPKPDWAGRLIKQYTLQHAEVGVASDLPKHELVPRTLAAAMWPQHKIKRMQQEAPHLFDHVRQYVIRLRLECDQILLRLKSWEDRAAWIDHLCMAVDIAPPLDDRTEPKYHTLPRRRRHRHPRGPEDNAQLSMTNLIEEQERIMRERFPHLLLDSDQRPSMTDIFEDPEDTAADPEAEDLDSTVVLAIPEIRPGDGRARGSTLFQAVDSMFEARAQFFRPSEPVVQLITNNISHDPKSSPTTQLDRSQELRYRRRCMPALLLSSRRCNDIIIRNGVRWQIDWESKALKRYPEHPPRYEPPDTSNGTDKLLLLDVQQALKAIPSSSTKEDPSDPSMDMLESATSSNARPSKSWKDPVSWSRRGRRVDTRTEEGDGSSSDNSDGINLNKLRNEQTGTTFGGETLRMLGI